MQNPMWDQVPLRRIYFLSYRTIFFLLIYLIFFLSFAFLILLFTFNLPMDNILGMYFIFLFLLSYFIFISYL